jgi:hypothetical protein
MKSMRAVAALGLASVLVLSLTSCYENFGSGPIAVKRDGAHMLIAVCTNVVAKSAFGEFNNVRTGTRIKTFLDATGSTEFHRGDIVSSGSDWPGMTMSTVLDPDLTAGGSLSVSLTPADRLQQFGAEFEFGDGGLSSKVWLHPGGTTTAQPCAGVRPIPRPTN